MASREEILADFQACTGIEDVGLAITQLEESGWVLVVSDTHFVSLICTMVKLKAMTDQH